MDNKIIDLDLSSIIEGVKKNEETKKKEPLGRGLAALLGNDANVTDDEEKPSGDIVKISVEDLQAGSMQPREHFNNDAIEGLAKSIEKKGILQPLIIRPLALNKYEIIAGERRFRAAKLAGLKSVPCIITNLKNVEALEIALIENVQREDLNPVEEAKTYKKLIDNYHHTHETLSMIIGKSRAYVTNYLRILNLPETIKQYLVEGKISAGHAKMLAGSEEPEKLAEEIIAGKLSVRSTEVKIKKAKGQSLSDSQEILGLRINFARYITPFKDIKSSSTGKIDVKLSFKDIQEAENFLKLFSKG